MAEDASPIPQALIARAHQSFVEAFRAVARAIPGGAVEEGVGLTLIASGLQFASFNRLFLLEAPADPAAAIARARGFFEVRRLPWSVVAAPEATASVARVSREAGLPLMAPLPAMLLSPLRLDPRHVPALEVREVAAPEDSADFVATAAAGFNAPRAVFEAFCHPRLLAATQDYALYVGYSEGRPVATATRLTASRIAGVYNIATLPAYRGRGFGEAMTARATLDGLREGALASYLQATPMGFPVYRRMGFHHVLDYAMWEAED